MLLFAYFFKSIQLYIFSGMIWFEYTAIHCNINAGWENLSGSDGTPYVKHCVTISELKFPAFIEGTIWDQSQAGKCCFKKTPQ